MTLHSIKASKINILRQIAPVATGLLCHLQVLISFGQPVLSNAAAEAVLLGNYNPATYKPSVVVNDKDSIISLISGRLSADSLKSYLTILETFGNRNSASDTLSQTRGIGAARQWIFHKFTQFSASSQNRLLVSYLNFTYNMCGVLKHKNVIGVLPGMDTSRMDVLVVEGHMDSRCEANCDTACYAPGMDDNGSGTVLVMELARVLSSLSFDRTIVFAAVTGEEQGLRGGAALAEYLDNKNVTVLGCLNNDVVGGIECGKRSSEPSCSPEGAIDSVNLRVFSFSPANDTNMASAHKQLARYIKLQQTEEINPVASTPTNIMLQIREDRVGRGGDHIPFRQRQFTAIRFTSSFEHGDGGGLAPDRQHTTTDVLGYDLSVPPDGILDTFLVDFSYLRRNTLTNGINLALLGNSPPAPQAVVEMNQHGNIAAIRFEGDDMQFSHRIGVRSNHSPDLYFDTVLTFSDHYITYDEITPGGDVQLHFMNVEGQVESIPSAHVSGQFLDAGSGDEEVNCIDLYPNPADGEVTVRWRCGMMLKGAVLKLIDAGGRLAARVICSGPDFMRGTILDLAELESGNYVLLAEVDGEEVFSRPVIIR